MDVVETGGDRTGERADRVARNSAAERRVHDPVDDVGAGALLGELNVDGDAEDRGTEALPPAA
jgi:hypothetical protein